MIGVTVLARFKKFSCLPSRDLHRGNQYTTREEHNLTRYVRRVLVIIRVRYFTRRLRDMCDEHVSLVMGKISHGTLISL